MARQYDATARSAAAHETRRRIIEAARDLLLGGGYRAMTVGDLAARAGVSPQTVYNSVGGKAEVVKAVYDTMLAGDDDPVPMSERPRFLAIQAAQDTAEWGAAYAGWSLSLMGRVGPLLAVLLEHGPGGDPVLEELVSKINDERRVGNDNAVKGLAARGVISGPPSQRRRVVDVVWTLTSPEVYDRLVVRCGWTERAYERWLAAELAAAVDGRGTTTRT